MTDVLVKTNLTATTAPTVTDDAAAGYDVFSPWVDVTAGNLYWCVDTTIGAAVWKQVDTPNVLVLGDNAGDPTMPAETAGFYAKEALGSVHAFAIDELGNAYQLTPHDEDGYHIARVRNGKTMSWHRIDIEKFFRDKFPEYLHDED